MDPIHHEVTVAATPERAFDLFTREMGSWWASACTADPTTFSGIDLMPEIGGTLAMRHGAASYPFGEVRVWEPGLRFGSTFWLAMDAKHPSSIDVTFTHDGSVCLMRFEHGGWTPENLEGRETYVDWPLLLGRFAAAAAAE